MDINDVDDWARSIASAATIKESKDLVRQLYRLGYERGRSDENLMFMRLQKEADNYFGE